MLLFLDSDEPLKMTIAVIMMIMVILFNPWMTLLHKFIGSSLFSKEENRDRAINLS